ncbi:MULTISPECIES: MFS transporter [Oceanimonas]|uniref:MFS transporter n=1 Tax=Oceanimonas smirnovii TaxID=264574 RepID=A0ABW7NZD7_9GAMM|nr:MFS transporter [Oceanimonas sp. CAM02]MDV2857661.1 MFS transporter [Oceanimonas sp. CAM02]
MIKGNYLNKSILAPFSAIYGVGLAPLLILPFIFTSVMGEFGVGESAAGSLITYYIATMCIASLAVAPIIGKAPRRTLTLVATLIAIAGSLGVMAADSYDQAVAAFVFAGIGSGIALSCGNAVVAGYKKPDESIHKIVLIGTILMVVLLNLVPSAIGYWSLAGAMAVLAVVHVLLLPFILMLPQHPDPARQQENEARSTLSVLLKPVSLAILAMVGFYFIRDTMVWVFAEHIGTSRIGMSPDSLGFLFGIHGTTSLLGPVILLWAGKYLGRGTLLVLGIVASGVITHMVTQTDSYPVYTAIVVLWSTAHFFTYSCMMALASVADTKGRIAAAAGSAVMAGTAVAPALAGYAFDLGGYGTLGYFVAAAVLLTLVSGLYALYALRRAEAGQPAAAMMQAD